MISDYTLKIKCTVEVWYNAIHEKSVYEAEYPDGTTEQLESNIMAENILSQVDS